MHCHYCTAKIESTYSMRRCYAIQLLCRLYLRAKMLSDLEVGGAARTNNWVCHRVLVQLFSSVFTPCLCGSFNWALPTLGSHSRDTITALRAFLFSRSIAICSFFLPNLYSTTGKGHHVYSNLHSYAVPKPHVPPVSCVVAWYFRACFHIRVV